VESAPLRDFTEEERRFFDAAWALFRRRAPEWPEAREQWISGGPEAQSLLAENLYRAMAASRAANAPELLEVSRKELIVLGAPAVPVLVGVLATRAIRTSEGDEIRTGQELRSDAAETLALIGAPAVPGLMDVAGCGEWVFAGEAIRALGNVADPRAEDLLLRLARDEEWRTRGAAALALRGYADERAARALLAALGDREPFVAKQAAVGLARRKRDDAVPGIVEEMERAARDGRGAAVKLCGGALRSITGERHGDDPAAWRRWLGSR